MRQTTVTVRLDIGDRDLCSSIKIDPVFEIKPVDFCTESIGAMTGGQMSSEYIVTLQLRKKVFDEISKAIALFLMDQLQSIDTVNGYKVDNDRDKQRLDNLRDFSERY